MKKTIIHSGFHQRSNEDIMHMQEGITEVLDAIMKALAAPGATLPNCTLWGCNITPAGLGLHNISAGAVLLDGEVCIFDGVNGIDLSVIAPNQLVYTTVDTYLPGNPITYGDLTTKNVHLIRKAGIISIAVSPAANQLPLEGQLNFIQNLQKKLSITESWRKLGTTGNPAMPTFGWLDVSSEIFFRKNLLDNSVELRGTLDLINTNTLNDPPLNYQLFIMPAGYIPAYEIPFIGNIRIHNVPYELNSNNDVIKGNNMAVEKTTGNVTINPEMITTNANVTLRFYVKYSLS